MQLCNPLIRHITCVAAQISLISPDRRCGCKGGRTTGFTSRAVLVGATCLGHLVQSMIRMSQVWGPALLHALGDACAWTRGVISVQCCCVVTRDDLRTLSATNATSCCRAYQSPTVILGHKTRRGISTMPKAERHQVQVQHAVTLRWWTGGHNASKTTKRLVLCPTEPSRQSSFAMTYMLAMTTALKARRDDRKLHMLYILQHIPQIKPFPHNLWSIRDYTLPMSAVQSSLLQHRLPSNGFTGSFKKQHT